MRETTPEVIKDGDKIIGIALPGNFCAEHERGIGIMVQKLGLGVKEGFGLPERTITNIDEITRYVDDDCAYIEFAVPDYYTPVDVDDLSHSFAEWDDRAARVAARKTDTDLFKAVRVLSEDPNRVAIIPSGTMVDRVFGKGGIAFVRTDLVPQEVSDDIAFKDSESHRLAEAWNPVREMIEDLRQNWTPTEYHKRFVGTGSWGSKRLGWFYIGPKCFEEEPIEDSEYPFLLWLNPEDQNIYSYGYYTVEEIVEWITEGTGPVVERSKAYQLVKAFEEWKETGSTDLVPDYYGICSECETLLHFGNGPLKEVQEFKPYPRVNSKQPGTCVKCGADHTKFVLSPYQSSEEYADYARSPW